jgi:hypothetical protein
VIHPARCYTQVQRTRRGMWSAVRFAEKREIAEYLTAFALLSLSFDLTRRLLPPISFGDGALALIEVLGTGGPLPCRS